MVWAKKLFDQKINGKKSYYFQEKTQKITGKKLATTFKINYWSTIKFIIINLVQKCEMVQLRSDLSSILSRYLLSLSES